MQNGAIITVKLTHGAERSSAVYMFKQKLYLPKAALDVGAVVFFCVFRWVE